MKRLLAIAFILAATTAYGETTLYTSTAPLLDIGSSTNNHIDIDNSIGTELGVIPDTPTCADCSPGQPCVKSEEVDCNTCTYHVWCVDGVWHRTNSGSCTLLSCFDDGIALPGNPFGGGE